MTYFLPSEFFCRCCGVERMNDAFVKKLDRLREACGFPLIITSGYRCPSYNDKIATTGRDGPHTTGRAVDIAATGDKALALLAAALNLNEPDGLRSFTGFGLKQKGVARFVHLDDLSYSIKRPRPWIWTY